MISKLEDNRIKLFIRKEARSIRIAAMTEQGEKSKYEALHKTVLSIVQLLAKLNPSIIRDKDSLIKTYMTYFWKLLAVEIKGDVETPYYKSIEEDKWKGRALNSVQSNSMIRTAGNLIPADVEEAKIRLELSKLAMRLVSVQAKLANITDINEIQNGYKKIFWAMYNTTIPQYK